MPNPEMSGPISGEETRQTSGWNPPDPNAPRRRWSAPRLHQETALSETARKVSVAPMEDCYFSFGPS